MTRQTIDFGIDLGTTNSSIAALDKNGPHIFRNNEGDQITPSAVYIDKKGAIRVGEAAKDRIVSEPTETAAEFKLWMGTEQKKLFARANRAFSSEELSAEILKSLRQDVKRSLGEDVEAAVITVPAAFDAPQSNATERAAKLAGIRVSPLLQEPIAAALAYGFQSDRENVFWLVYDFGGGTFDAAVIHVRDGLIQVVNHGGDNDLGGKLIDWAIVEQIFVPKILREFKLSDFNRNNQKWRGAFAKLKHWAEKAKIALSKDQGFDLPEEFVCLSDDGKPVQLECAVSRTQVEALLHPHLAKTINICRRVLAEKKLGVADIDRVLLVGGPTYMPYLRQMLPDAKDGLGIQLEFGIDPLTVVAQGAALFAGGQKITKAKRVPQAGGYSIELEYKPIGAETEPLVGGRVVSAERKILDGFALRFTNSEAKPAWNSGNVPIQEDGTFMVTLWAEKQQQNRFSIELFDSTGRKRQVSPESMLYTVGLVITDPPLTHTIGIAMANNEVDIIFEKGMPLPARSKIHTHQTVIAVRRGSSEGKIKIPLVEGDHRDAADLNRRIGEFTLDLSDVNRDLPLGTEIEIKIEIDSSRLLKGSIYIPLLDKEFPLRIDLVRREPNLGEMTREFVANKEKLQSIQEDSSRANDAQALKILGELAEEDIVASIAALLGGEAEGQDARTCENQLLNLKQAIHKLEAQSEIPRLLEVAKNEIQWTQEAVEANGSQDERRQFEELKRDVESAMNGDVSALEKRIARLFQLRIRILARTPEYWVGYKEYLAERLDVMTDQAQAQLWLNHADKAIRTNDLEALRSACTQLGSLLPVFGEFRGYGGTTLRSRGGR
jgi:molecular chaperone DnaK